MVTMMMILIITIVSTTIIITIIMLLTIINHFSITSCRRDRTQTRTMAIYYISQSPDNPPTSPRYNQYW